MCASAWEQALLACVRRRARRPGTGPRRQTTLCGSYFACLLVSKRLCCFTIHSKNSCSFLCTQLIYPDGRLESCSTGGAERKSPRRDYFWLTAVCTVHDTASFSLFSSSAVCADPVSPPSERLNGCRSPENFLLFFMLQALRGGPKRTFANLIKTQPIDFPAVQT